MHTAAKKLHSRRGASMLFALLVFFLCLLAGVAALTAAAANAGRYTHLEGQQQQYLSVASALDVLQAEMVNAAKADGALYVKATCVETETWDNSSAPPSTPSVTRVINLDPSTTTLNYFQYLLLKNNLPAEWAEAFKSIPNKTAAVSNALDSGDPWTGPTVFDISLEPSTGTSDFDAWPYPVHVEVKSSGDGYTLEMKLSTKEDGAYPLTVVWSGEPEVTTEVKTETKPGLTASEGQRITTTTLTCALHWSADKRTVTFG